mgnify:CR=1 FL=1
MLTQVNENWTILASVVFVMFVQGLSGVSKDLTKMSSKSAVKLLAPEKNTKLFKWVTFLTGSKNTVKGLGFFIGGLLLYLFDFQTSLVIMSIILFVVISKTLDFFLAISVLSIFVSYNWGEKRVFYLLLVGIIFPLVVFIFFEMILGLRFPPGIITNLYYY